MTNLSGFEFNQKYYNKQFVKLTTIDENHNGFQFHTGLNNDHLPFNPSGRCRSGGLYFCQLDHITKWLVYNFKLMHYCRYVTIPNDALIYDENNKYKANKIILGDRIPISDLDIWNDSEFCLKAVKQNALALKYAKIQTPKIIMSALNQNGHSLGFVKEQTEELCLVAVKSRGMALKFVTKQTPKICLEAVNQDGWALKFVSQQTPELCLIAVKQNGSALQWVHEQTPEICLEAVKQNGLVLEWVHEQTPEICLEAVKQRGTALKYVKQQTSDICIAAFRDVEALN